ncbi:MAG TPA: hypothetical protein VL981_06310 [Candidatus Methylacidiphilales bacterium]|nr:hypothetical protein [Candidatus Methylacidiphilales bacterium]
MIQEITYGGWKRNLRLHAGATELVITLDVGPRVIRYACGDGPNAFAEISGQMGGSGENEWKIRGGHRFWTAPEGDHSYDLDNGPVTWKELGDDAVEIIQPPSKSYGFQKSLKIELLEHELVRVTHRLANVGTKPLTFSSWALSVMAPGGVTLIPQPPLDLHPSEFASGREVNVKDFWPNREIVLWPFTNLSDGRYAYSEHFLRISYHPSKPATKIGLKFPTGWVAYQNRGCVFAKHFAYDPAQPYPDRGSNFEFFTNPDIVELESLAPALPLAPGASGEHVEHWRLFQNAPDLRDEKAAFGFFEKLPRIG